MSLSKKILKTPRWPKKRASTAIFCLIWIIPFGISRPMRKRPSRSYMLHCNLKKEGWMTLKGFIETTLHIMKNFGNGIETDI